MSSQSESTAIAVYCGSSTGRHAAYTQAAISLGKALAKANRPLVYGGGSKGIMGTVSQSVLAAGGKVTGVIPHAMVAAGGEGEKSDSLTPANPAQVVLEPNSVHHETIVVDSMHDRKVEMAKRACGFVGLPGGFGTFEEVLEVITWTQLGIHNKPVVLVNVLNFYEPLRQLINGAVRDGFIQSANQSIVIFIDGPEEHSTHENHDWGNDVLKAIETWQGDKVKRLYDWATKIDGQVRDEGNLGAS